MLEVLEIVKRIYVVPVEAVNGHQAGLAAGGAMFQGDLMRIQSPVPKDQAPITRVVLVVVALVPSLCGTSQELATDAFLSWLVAQVEGLESWIPGALQLRLNAAVHDEPHRLITLAEGGHNVMPLSVQDILVAEVGQRLVFTVDHRQHVELSIVADGDQGARFPAAQAVPGAHQEGIVHVGFGLALPHQLPSHAILFQQVLYRGSCEGHRAVVDGVPRSSICVILQVTNTTGLPWSLCGGGRHRRGGGGRGHRRCGGAGGGRAGGGGAGAGGTGTSHCGCRRRCGGGDSDRCCCHRAGSGGGCLSCCAGSGCGSACAGTGGRG
mmetsp:Transcript_39316/g.80423  ORF Transcript_39316/g.80423 Transcript_39316/m.80423 type:complete len:323 (+) Transcript_39316:105-1073(+)